MSGIMGLYARHLGAEGFLPPVPQEELDDRCARAADLIGQAGTVVVGIGSGLSSSCGYDFYHRSDAFDGDLARFERRHGFSTFMDGLYHLFATNEERWAYLAALTDHLERCEVGEGYRLLRRILDGHRYTVITSNIDGQARRAFPEGRRWLFQGDFHYLQCSQPCSSRIVPAEPLIRPMLEAMGGTGTSVAPDLLPRCPDCGWLMMPWVRDDGFVEGPAWREQRDRYQATVRAAMHADDPVVFLEIGVGEMTPGVITFPFWSMTQRHPHAAYIQINVGEREEPRHLAGKSLVVPGDATQCLKAIADAIA